MSITIVDFGKHKDVLNLRFGTGDILFTKCRHQGAPAETMMFFSHSHPKPVGTTTDEYKGLDSDNLPTVRMIMEFENPEAINAVVSSLLEIQMGMIQNPEKPNLNPEYKSDPNVGTMKSELLNK